MSLHQGPTTGSSAELRARTKSKACNSSLALELHLGRGGTLAEWYACAAAPPVETREDRRKAELARLIRHMPNGLTDAEQTAWLAVAALELP